MNAPNNDAPVEARGVKKQHAIAMSHNNPSTPSIARTGGTVRPIAGERPYVLKWRSAIFSSGLSSTVKLCLLALSEWADSDGSNCFPSIPRIASVASVNERTVRRCLDQAETTGFIKRRHMGTAQGWRRYIYSLMLPPGADTAPIRSKAVAGTQSTPSGTTPGHTIHNARTSMAEGTGIVSTDLALTHPLPSFTEPAQKTDGKPEQHHRDPKVANEAIAQALNLLRWRDGMSS